MVKHEFTSFLNTLETQLKVSKGRLQVNFKDNIQWDLIILGTVQANLASKNYNVSFFLASY